MVLSLGNVGKYEYLTGEDVLPEKGLLEKVAVIKIFTMRYWVEKPNYYRKTIWKIW